MSQESSRAAVKCEQNLSLKSKQDVPSAANGC